MAATRGRAGCGAVDDRHHFILEKGRSRGGIGRNRECDGSRARAPPRCSSDGVSVNNWVGIGKKNGGHQMIGTTVGSEAMSRQRREMMKLIRDVPEADYELTLRDMVELHAADAQAELGSSEKEAGPEKGGGREVGSEGAAAAGVARSRSAGGGGAFLFGVFFPAISAGKRQSSREGAGKLALEEFMQTEAWNEKRQQTRASKSGRRKKRMMAGCFPCFRTKVGKEFGFSK